MRTLTVVVGVASVLSLALTAAAGEQISTFPRAPASAGAPQDARMFEGFEFSGNTVFTDEALAGVLMSYQGKPVDQRQLSDMANKVAYYYRDRGYLARVAAAGDAGTAKLQVTESKVGELSIKREKGPKRYSDGFLRDHFAAIRPGAVWSMDDLERSVLLVQGLPAMGRVKAELREGAEGEGTTDITILVEENPDQISGEVAFDTFGSPDVSRERVSEKALYGNLSGRGDDLSLQIVHGPDPTELLFGEFRYDVPLNAKGTRVAVYGRAGDFEVGRNFALLGLAGDGVGYGIVATHPLVRSKRRTLEAQFGFDAEDAKLKSGLFDTETSNDKIRAIRLGANYDEVTSAGKTRNIATLTLHQGLDDWLGGMESGASSSRPPADNKFTKITLEAARLRKLNDRLFLFSRLTGQYANDSLVVGEQMAIGGANSVRGFTQSEFLGDSGVRANVELRYTPSWGKKPGWLADFQGVCFVDHGSVWLKHPASGEPDSHRITGVGVGFRAMLKCNVAIRADLGYGLTQASSGGGRLQPYVEVRKPL